MLSSEDGLATMHSMLGAHHAQQAAVLGAVRPAYWLGLLAKVQQLPHLYSELGIRPALIVEAASGNGDTAAAAQPAQPPVSAQPALWSPAAVEAAVNRLVATVLGVEGADPDAPLAAQGLDSLAGLELRQKVQVRSQTALRCCGGCTTVVAVQQSRRIRMLNANRPPTCCAGSAWGGAHGACRGPSSCHHPQHCGRGQRPTGCWWPVFGSSSSSSSKQPAWRQARGSSTCACTFGPSCCTAGASSASRPAVDCPCPSQHQDAALLPAVRGRRVGKRVCKASRGMVRGCHVLSWQPGLTAHPAPIRLSNCRLCRALHY